MKLKFLIYLLLILISVIIIGPLHSILCIPAIIFLFGTFLFFKSYSNIKYSFRALLSIKLMLLLLLWIVISYILLLSFGKGYSIIRLLSACIFGYVVAIFICYLLGILCTIKFNKRKMINLVVIALYVIFAYAIYEFIIFKLNIKPLTYVFSFISGRDLSNIINYKLGTIPRLQSLFAEPSHFAWFLVCNIPLVIKLGTSKYKIFKNKYVNFVIKKSIIPITYIMLLCTKSPINLIFGIAVTVIYKLITLKLTLKQYLKLTVITLLFISILLITLSRIDISATYLNRIILSAQALGNINILIYAEPSLATRLISYYNMFLIFLKNIFLGVGWGNLNPIFVNQLGISPIPITPELKSVMLSPKPVVNPAIGFKVLSETGIIGGLLFYSTLIYLYKIATFVSKKSDAIIRDFSSGVSMTILVYICLSFYDSQLYCHYFWILFGIISGIYLEVKYAKKNHKG